MKKTLQISTLALCLSISALAQQSAGGKTTLTPHTLNSAGVPVYNPSSQQNSGGQDVQMVTCTDKVTYCDRHNTTVYSEQIGGYTGLPVDWQVFPDYTGTVTQVFASLKRFSNNTVVRIAIFPISGGYPTTTYNAYYDATVTSGTLTEYGGNLTGTTTVTNGFAIGCFLSPANPNDSAEVGYRQDPDSRNLSYYYDPYGMFVASNFYDASYPLDYEMRPKISFPAPTISFTPNPSTSCAGTPITFNGNPATGIPAHYQGSLPVVYNDPITNCAYSWDFGDAGTSNLPAPVTHTYAAAGNYTITKINTFGGWTTTCPTAPATATVTITGVTPSVSISTNTNPVCPNGTSNFTAVPTNGGSSPSYVWKKNGVQVGTGAAYSGSSWAAGDVMTCEMVSNAACAPSSPVVSNSITMYLQPIVFSSFNYTATGLSVSFTSTAANAVTWSWNFGDAGNSSSATPVHNYASPGVYTVDLTVTNSCGQTNVSSINITVSSSGNSSGGNTGLVEKELQVNVNAFPNPVNNDLNINYSINHTTDVRIEVLNMLGQTVATQVINTTSVGTAHVSMENMASGLYFVRFTAGENNVQIMRIVHE